MTTTDIDKPEAPSAPEDQIGERIAQKRIAKGLNHDGLSKLTKLLDSPSNSGISRTTIRGYEVGLYKPGARELRMLSEALEVTPTWLIFGGEESSNSESPARGEPEMLPKTDLEKGLFALFMLWKLDAPEREVIYGVLHSMSRLKHGENAYRASTMAVADMMALFNDFLSDMREGKTIESDNVQALALGHIPKLQKKLEEEFGLTFADLWKKTI